MEQLTFTEQMMQTSNDICYNRHGGNEQSKAANKRVRKETDRGAIINYLQEFKTGTSKQIAEHLGKQLNKISGRFTSLKNDNIIVPCISIDGIKWIVDGCQVYRLTKRND